MSFFEIASVARPQGIRGELKLNVYTTNASRFAPGAELTLSHRGVDRVYTIVSSRFDGNTAIVKLDGIDDRDAVEVLRGAAVLCKRTGSDELPQGEHYICDLIGLDMYSDSGEFLGKLADVLQYGAADIYVVTGSRSFSFPALSRVITSVDIPSGRMTLCGAELSKVCIYEDQHTDDIS